MKKLLWAFLAVCVPAAYAAPIFITISFTGTGSVGGFGFTSQTVTVTAIADTANVSFPFGPGTPAYQPPTSLTITVPGFGTGTATNPAISIGNQEGQGTGSVFIDAQGFVYLSLNNAAFNAWNLTTQIGPVTVSGDSTQGFVQLNNNDVWGTLGLATTMGNVKVTYAANVVVTASMTAPGPVTVFSPAQNATGVSLTPTLTWGAVAGGASYDLYFGTSPLPPYLASTTGTSYTPGTLSANTTYYWYLVSKNAAGSATSAIWSFSTGVFTQSSFFTGQAGLGNDVYYLQFPNGNIFGYYNDQYFPTIYHYDLGFEYFVDASDGKSGAYFYDFASGHWFYTSPSFPFPYLYDFTLQSILYYYPLSADPGRYTSNPRYFYNYSTGAVITM